MRVRHEQRRRPRGAISLFNSTVDVINNLFVENEVTGTGGGAVYAYSVARLYPHKYCRAWIINNTFVENWALDIPSVSNGNGGAVLARCQDANSSTELTLINNVLYENRGSGWQRSTSTGNSVWLDVLSVGSLLYCGAYSSVAGTATYHYMMITPGAGCITQQIVSGDPPIFTDGWRLSLSGPWYTPLDHGHDRGSSPYDKVPLDDLAGVERPQGTYTDMGAFEAQQ